MIMVKKEHKKKEEQHEAKQDDVQQKPEEIPKTEVDILKEKNADLLKTVQMLQAEFENYKKRVDRDRQVQVTMANKDLILSILPVLDNFEIALASHKDVDKEFLKGMELIYSQLFDILKKQGLEPIATLEQKFDPYKHECLMQGDSDKESGTIIEEFQKGYMLNETVIRPAKVKIAK